MKQDNNHQQFKKKQYPMLKRRRKIKKKTVTITDAYVALTKLILKHESMNK